jgi:hypothetical protein
MSATHRAWLVVGAFSLLGVLGFTSAPQSALIIPHIFFYVVLIINTFFSVRLFAAIQPDNFSQRAADLILAFIYAALALSIGDPVGFAFFALCLFVAATPKYAMMLGVVSHDTLLKKKVLIDLCGTVMCTVVLGGTLFGYPLASAWALGGVFAAANVLLLYVRPMYRIS